MGRLIIILLVIAIIALIIYLCIKSVRDTFKDTVDYTVTVLFMQGKIDNDTYIAYASMKNNEKYAFLHDYKKLKGYRKGELYSDFLISKNMEKNNKNI